MARARFKTVVKLYVFVILQSSIVICSSPPVDDIAIGYSSKNINDGPQSENQDESILELLSTTDLNVTKSELHHIYNLLGNSSHTHDNDMIDVRTSSIAWHLMEKQALSYMKAKINFIRPSIVSLLLESQVTDQCKNAIDSWLEALVDFKQWAYLMWNAWGEMPAPGLFEGSFTDLGSYRGCMSVNELIKRNSIDKTEQIKESVYCALDLQPLVPTRPRFHSILKQVLSIEEGSNRMTHGDFEYTTESMKPKLSSHGFASARVRQPNTKPRKDRSKNQQLTATIQTETFKELAKKAHYFYYVKLRIGSCFPSQCTNDDVYRIIHTAGKKVFLQAGKVNCLKSESKSINRYQWFAIIVLASFIFVGLVGTIVDIFDIKALQTLVLFSIIKNSKRMFDTTSSSGSHSDLSCVHGLRFFSMLWVIFGHTILYSEYQSFTHFFNTVENEVSSFTYLPLLDATFSVDTFYVISGLLTSYVTWEYTKGDPKQFNSFAFAISRYIRLTPQMSIVILLFFLLPLLGSGPLFDDIMEREASRCYKNWYLNIFYLQNFIDEKNMCMAPSWWLGVEMTFHIISVPIIFVLMRSASLGLLLNAMVALLFTVIGAIKHYMSGFTIQYLPSIPQRYEINDEQTDGFFHLPYPHAASYSIGLALGYLLAKGCLKSTSPTNLRRGWLLCASCLLIPIYGCYYWNLGFPYTQLQATFYWTLIQTLWPVGIAWIIYACSIDCGGIVQSILCAKSFIPLGRITYMTYLSHAIVLYYLNAIINVPREPSPMLFISSYISSTFFSLLLGAFLTIVYESPLLNLQKLLIDTMIKKFGYKPEQKKKKELENV